jgi:hypothetical protein
MCFAIVGDGKMSNDFQKSLWKTQRGSKIARILASASKSVSGESESEGNLGIPVGLGTVVGVIFPSELNSATKIVFEVSNDDQTYVPLNDVDGARIECAVTVSTAAPLSAADFHPWDYVRVETLDAGDSAVTQTGNRDIILIVARV